MLVQLYFATSRAYLPGQILRVPAGAQAYHLGNAAAEWLAMETAFEAARPATHHSRMTSRFACETMEDCLTYYGPQAGGNVKRVYRVFMNDPVSVPMALTGRGHHHHASPATMAAIAQEYWEKQQHAWEYLEYLAPEMGVIDEVLTPPDAMLLAASAFSYQNDRTRAIQLWP